jgi:oligoribonuclease (3'-5' exoribonuclease)
MSEIRYLWLDFESDGTDPVLSRIIEAGIIATGEELEDEIFTIDTMVKDGDLNDSIRTIESVPVLLDMHGRNGLLADLKRVRDGKMEAITLEDLDRHLYDLIKTNNKDDHKIILSGSGVGHYDHNVIKEKMPLLASLLIFYPRDIGHTRREFLSATGRNLVDINSHKYHRAFQDIVDHKNETIAFRDYFRKAEQALAILGVE